MGATASAVGEWWGGLSAGSQAAITTVGAAAVQAAAAPKPPGVPAPLAMPDPMATEAARQKMIAETVQRSGRASTILTQPPASEKLGA